MSAEQLPIDPQRARAIAQEFDMLQGLILVPAGIGTVFFGVLYPISFTTGTLLLLAAIGLGMPLTTSWYAKHYGRVRTSRKRDAAAAVIALLVIAAHLVALGLDHFEQLPVMVSLLLAAVVLWVSIRVAARRLGMRAVDHLVPAALAVAALGPLAVGTGEFPAVPYFFVLTGTGLVILGFAWHHRLVNLLGDPHAA
ncbi:hypothetical protein [Bogoriella caseilytica]|uniref:Uncharacterized protein n=1 Tax=Bogoriella caseilytica TaxID=56055 RepID=A0A3N2BAW3_9MICO|nr:hypothetical protein [Bogoriella caseilytica]ROR72377.1 hypothetical protein EDD31_0728 [Bogoriella caseilytica]